MVSPTVTTLVTCHYGEAVLLQVSDVIDMKEDALNPTVLTMVLSEERGHVYQFQTPHELAVFRSVKVQICFSMLCAMCC